MSATVIIQRLRRFRPELYANLLATTGVQKAWINGHSNLEKAVVDFLDEQLQNCETENYALMETARMGGMELHYSATLEICG